MSFVGQYPGVITGGTVTSVGLAAPALFTVTGSPVINSGTLTLSYSGTALPIANGGTGLTAVGTAYQLLGTNTGATAFTNLSLSGTSNQVTVTPSGTTLTLSLPQNIHTGASPTFAGLTLTGFSGAVSASEGVLSAGTLSIANGGTNATAATTAFNNLSPLTTLGDLLYGGASGAGTRLAGNITSVKNFLNQTGTGSVSAAPAWGTIGFSDLTGSVSAGQMPALTGDVTSPAGTVATTAAAIQANITTLSNSAGCQIHGTNTNDNAAAGYVGEFIQSTVTTNTAVPGSTGAFGDMTSISLTAGDWDVSLLIALINNGATATTLQYGISTTSGNSSSGLTYGDNFFLSPWSANGISDSNVMLPVYRISLSGTTTVYAKLLVSYSGTPNFRCRLSARRVR